MTSLPTSKLCEVSHTNNTVKRNAHWTLTRILDDSTPVYAETEMTPMECTLPKSEGMAAQVCAVSCRGPSSVHRRHVYLVSWSRYKASGLRKTI